MLVVDLIIPLTMIILGAVFMKKPPKNINYLFGYRTPRSTKNEDTWQFAHNYCGKIWVSWGWVLLILSLLPFIILIGKDKDLIATVGGAISIIQLIVILLTIVPVEKALKKTFDENGNRK